MSNLSDKIEDVLNSRALEIMENWVTEKIVNADFSSITANGVSLRVGDRTLHFDFSHEDVSDTDIIRKDLEKKYQKSIEDYLREIKMDYNGVRLLLERKKREIENLKNSLDERMKGITPIPDGLGDYPNISVTKYGSEMIWQYRGVYWLKTVDDKPLKAETQKKTITPITICVRVSQGKILGIWVMDVMARNKFSHYHGMSHNSDCWGSWRYSSERINDVSDVDRICRHALSILSNVNTRSMANMAPEGLPKYRTLLANIEETAPSRVKPSRLMSRLSVSESDSPRVQRTSWTTETSRSVDGTLSNDTSMDIPF